MTDNNKRKNTANTVLAVGMLVLLTGAVMPFFTNDLRTSRWVLAAGALMTGSGPTVFGLFDDRNKAAHALRKMKEEGAAKDIFLTEPYQK